MNGSTSTPPVEPLTAPQERAEQVGSAQLLEQDLQTTDRNGNGGIINHEPPPPPAPRLRFGGHPMWENVMLLGMALLLAGLLALVVKQLHDRDRNGEGLTSHQPGIEKLLGGIIG